MGCLIFVYLNYFNFGFVVIVEDIVLVIFE